MSEPSFALQVRGLTLARARRAGLDRADQELALSIAMRSYRDSGDHRIALRSGSDAIVEAQARDLIARGQVPA